MCYPTSRRRGCPLGYSTEIKRLASRLAAHPEQPRVRSRSIKTPP